MLTLLDDFSAKLLGSRTFKLEVDATIPEAVELLEREVSTGAQVLLPKRGLAGRITPSKVTVRYRSGLFDNGWAPIFRGTLEQTEQGVRLSGRYTLLRWVSALIIGSLGFLLVATMALFAREVVIGDAGEAFRGLVGMGGMTVVFAFFHTAGIALGWTETKEIEQRLRGILG
ncbi:hypothetical protein FIV42_24580 [Persicimonas caeni]|uniref:Uncharacterized protein n=1 Tax=Persicimonas caeni TaxID=2292766 RepID=A0A4Y6PZW2_PERCE|nr:hypothetical protein [Persicimonas caeni]QDG53803.1 hypothetical protein FIV42_24580 [Persicimonas caeni]QED35024.1 hypothetical protein FRD00_24575 [Persicimonas caeni]